MQWYKKEKEMEFVFLSSDRSWHGGPQGVFPVLFFVDLSEIIWSSSIHQTLQTVSVVLTMTSV